MEDPKINVVSSEEAENAQFVVCARKGSASSRYFTDNEEGVCVYCDAAIVFRPYAPKKPPKICIDCALAMANPQ